MKHLKLFLFLFLPLPIFSQNLVKNPSFENLYSCSVGTNQLDTAINWTNPLRASRSSPDLYSGCASNGGIPNNYWGRQQPRTGNTYAGICPYYNYSLFSNFREYVQGELTSPLQAGQTYEVSFWVSSAEYSPVSITNMGVYLSPTMVWDTTPGRLILPQTPQVFSNNLILSDTASWIEVKWNYQATGGEQYIILGNFNDDANTTQVAGSGGRLTYYYIDDVSVVPANLTTTNELSKKSIVTVFPNPTSDKLHLNIHQEGNGKVILFDYTGKEIYTESIDNINQIDIDTQTLPKGMYILKVMLDNNVYTEKIVVR